MICKNCGAEIEGGCFLCPKCGAPVNYTSQTLYEAEPEYAYEPDKPNKVGTVGLIISLFSLFLGEYYCIMSAVGVIVGIVALVKMKKCNMRNWTAIAAFVVGVVSLIVWIVLWVTESEWIMDVFM
ncbi:MAG: DUF4190 domain-containing protein [Clostridia bacterium]|nr:DUF4190 domain-containing protein [Clostridia bacterium]